MVNEIVVGSLNPAKIEAVKRVVGLSVQVTAIDADSTVSAQPFSEEETRKGAVERARAALQVQNSATIGIGLEGGVVTTDIGIMLCNWGAIVDKEGCIFIASGAKIPLPSNVTERLEVGEELGTIMADLTNDADVRKKEGAVGIFTNGYVNRTDMFSHVVQLLIGQYLYAKK